MNEKMVQRMDTGNEVCEVDVNKIAEHYSSGGRDGSSEHKTYGITSPISVDMPTDYDWKLTAELENCLKDYGLYETEEEMQRRMEVLRKINAIVKEWVKDLSAAKNLPEDMVNKVGGKVFTFGSYRLGVHTKGADIDALCVSPRHIERTDFFSSFVDLLRARSEVTDMHCIEEAFVPVIKMKFDEIEIDMLFARLSIREVSDEQGLEDDSILRNLDEKSVRSLNGCRVTDEILRLVPNKHTFRLSLRAIKLWAKCHGIYSNVLGYLGGVSWAMLVARTCQLYPNAAPSTLVQKFFLIFSRWEWPSPVLLKPMETSPPVPTLQEFVWDPRTKVADRYHLMPIITPAFPQQNSTFNVSVSTRTIMQQKFNEGFSITQEIMVGKAPWTRLFEPPNFFSLYKHYIVLICSAETREDHITWAGLVESKIRFLISSFERNQAIQLVHIHPQQYTPVQPHEPNHLETMWFMGLELNKQDSQVKNINLTDDIQNFTEHVTKQASYNNFYKESMLITAKYVKRRGLSAYLPSTVLRKGLERTKSEQQLVASGSNSNSNAPPLPVMNTAVGMMSFADAPVSAAHMLSEAVSAFDDPAILAAGPPLPLVSAVGIGANLLQQSTLLPDVSALSENPSSSSSVTVGVSSEDQAFLGQEEKPVMPLLKTEDQAPTLTQPRVQLTSSSQNSYLDFSAAFNVEENPRDRDYPLQSTLPSSAAAGNDILAFAASAAPVAPLTVPIQPVTNTFAFDSKPRVAEGGVLLSQSTSQSATQKRPHSPEESTPPAQKKSCDSSPADLEESSLPEFEVKHQSTSNGTSTAANVSVTTLRAS